MVAIDKFCLMHKLKIEIFFELSAEELFHVAVLVVVYSVQI